MIDQVLLLASYGILFACWSAPLFNILLPVWLNLITTATCVVFIGAHRSIALLITEENGGSPSSKKETMSTKDVMQFPVVGSCALFGLFIAFKYYKAYATVILSFYFAIVGVFTLTNTIAPLVGILFPSPKKYGFKKTFPLIGEVDAEFTMAELISLVPSAVFAAIHFKHKQPLMNNVLGISFCVQAIEAISLGNYRNGAILLLGLFVYDIFWVFYSESFFGDNVMVSVAQNLDEPIKLLFPLSLPGNGTVVAKALQETIQAAKNQTLIKSNPGIFSQKGSPCMAILNDLTKTLGASFGNPMDVSSPLKEMTSAAFLKMKETRLLEPKDYQRNCTKIITTVMAPLKNAVEGKQSLLGLGDIVIPGLFVAILHRFDFFVTKLVATKDTVKFPIPSINRAYFYTSVVFYALGLGATLWGMQKCTEWYPKGNCAQPALLYLVPACMLASLIVAIARGQLGDLIKYDEEGEEVSKPKKE